MNELSRDPLFEYTLHLSDNALILGHRNSEWTGFGPILEQDIAISNIALDLIGQARNFYQYAARLQGGDTTEDSLAYLRDVGEFKNCLLVEQDNGDWAKTILRQFLFSTYQYYFFQKLQRCNDPELAGIAEKSLKETTYHLRWSGEWVIRLGDGTSESHERMLKAMDELAKFCGELLVPADFEKKLIATGIAVDLSSIQPSWNEKVNSIFAEATLPPFNPQDSWALTGGKQGVHTEQLGYILAEMQYLQRAYPNNEW